MNLPEVCWRLQQKALQEQEKRSAVATPQSVCERLFCKKLSAGSVNTDALPLWGEPFESVFHPDGYTPETSIHLLGGFDYDKYKERWHAGFQTENDWPLVPSYKLGYKQRDDIGDARTNWELNRGFQFALLAQAYQRTGKKGYLDELRHLFQSWNEANPWLMGISWTSVMEVAIRAIQWSVSAIFLTKAGEKDLAERFSIGALNMADYVRRHYSRYSSANNHLLVEACSLVVVGKVFSVEEWQKLGMRLLDEEIGRQNYSDGVNKEMALHYQTFAMEAYAVALLACKSEAYYYDRWKPWLERQCSFVAWSVSSGLPMEWGDNDEGKIIDLRGGSVHWNHYKYVLNLYRHLGIFSGICKDENEKHFARGGYTFMRSADHQVLLGIDHAPLGFGQIAAHGHADALSIQLHYKGKALLTDPGTFIYHCYLDERNAFRKTINHNTLCLEGKDQSEMLGAFLWGRRAETKVVEYSSRHLKVSHNGYAPTVHTRTIDFNGTDCFIVTDNLTAEANYASTFVVGKDIEVERIDEATVVLKSQGEPMAQMDFAYSCGKLMIEEADISTEYGKKLKSKAIRLYGRGGKITTTIKLL